MPTPSPLFIAVGQHGQRLTSVDGVEWKNLQLGKEGETFRAIAFGNGRFVAVGSYGGNNIVAATTDGITWQQASKDAKYVAYIRGLTFGDKLFVGLGGDPGSVGDSKPFVTTSTDGLNWSENLSMPGRHILRRAAFGNGRYVKVGDRGRRTVSTDLKTWTDAPNVKAIDTLVDIAFGTPGNQPTFVGVGLHGLRMHSSDGLKWSAPQRGEEGEHLNAVVWTEKKFVAVGMGATHFSADGVTWQREKNHDAPLSITFGRGVFVGSNWKGRLMRSTDGVQWMQAHKCEHHVEAIAFGLV